MKKKIRGRREGHTDDRGECPSKRVYPGIVSQIGSLNL